MSDTYTINVLPVGNSPAPALSTNTVQLDPNGSQPLSATVNASGLAPGKYQGYLQVTGPATSNVATIPYWFAVPDSSPARITIPHQDYSDPMRTVSYGAVVFRIVDIAGTYAVDIRAGTSTMELSISIAGLTQSVIIGVN